MSESYTDGGDTLAHVRYPKCAAQTFIPKETHILEWIDLELKLTTISPEPIVLIYNTDAWHRPSGEYLSRDRYMIRPTKSYFSPQRIRFSMQAATLIKDVKYIIVVERYPGLIESGLEWQYHKEDATYARGARLYSENGGDTWKLYPYDDHIFAEFGTPPAPLPPPDPPVLNFAVLDIVQTVTYSGYHFLVTTNVPCHLYMEWTTTEPEKHTEPILRRGEYFKDAVRYCFVTYHENEQAEAGDTIYHTFVKAPWPICETRYFTFRATIDGEWSPSVSAIFTKHRKEAAWFNLLTETWDWYGVDPPPCPTNLIVEPWSS